MKTTITIDKVGRIVIPKSIRERMHLGEGSRLNIELVGDRIELSQEADEVRIERRGKLRVVVGGRPFDAGQAILDEREARTAQLSAGDRSS